MNREIKFRGKDIRGKWHYGYFYKAKYHVNQPVLHSFIATPRPKKHNKPSVITMVLPETVGQYTGLKDKNGVEIYEGDKGYIDDCLMVVGWDKSDGKFVLVWDDIQTDFSIEDSKWFEVISNIHDERVSE